MTHRAVLRAVAACGVAILTASCAALGGGPAVVGPSTTSAATGTTTTSAPTTTTTTAPPTTTTTPPATLDEVIAATIEDLDDFWAVELPAVAGVPYTPVAATGGYDLGAGDTPSCGDEELPSDVASGNAFYCQEDDLVAWDAVGLFPTLDADFGPFTVSLVLAHEWGHAIQQRLGVPTSVPTIVRELQADCLAGVWTAHALDGGGRVPVTEGDLDLATAGFLLFRDPTGTSAAEPGAHGNAFDRVGAFLDGIRGGSTVCVGYIDEFPPITQRPFVSAEDAARGGDVPFVDVIPLLVPTLEVYWEETMAATATSWRPVVDVVAYGDGTPSCVGPFTDPASIPAGVAHCADGTVHVDIAGTMADLYERFGDFGAAFLLGLGWAQHVQAELGLVADTRTGRLQADCLNGAWTGALAEGITTGTDAQGSPTGGMLSPGDVDEAIQAILALGDVRDDASAFERVEAFRSGYLGGAATCLGT